MSAMLLAGAKRLGRMAKTSFAVVGLAGTASAVAYGYSQRKFLQEDSKAENYVLVLPFHQIKLVNKHKRKSLAQVAQAARSSNRLEELDIHELVELIHEASADPNIIGLYGEFGHGRGFEGGAADAEEIRNALRVFRESHRVHSEPNFDHKETLPKHGNKEPKTMHAYADTFSSLGQSSNPDYYLASIFPEISIQKQGCLNLFGYCATIPFFRHTLEKYGAKVHCYKHGDFKNAPNQFTHSYLTKQHRQNVQNYLFALNEYQCQDISNARPRAKLDNMDLWKLIQNSGSFTPSAAYKMGLMDHAVDKSPLDTLTQHKDVKKITLTQYRKKVAQRKRIAAQKTQFAEKLQTLVQKTPPALQSLLESQEWYSKLRLPADTTTPKETIALLSLQGSIDSKQWNQLSPSLEKIKKDDSIQALVVRIESPGGSIEASETILQELKALNKKMVVSFGNVAASGGYYIATPADQIFASQNTFVRNILWIVG
jgi:protease IV